jgi:hypothetical protein
MGTRCPGNVKAPELDQNKDPVFSLLGVTLACERVGGLLSASRKRRRSYIAQRLMRKLTTQAPEFLGFGS